MASPEALEAARKHNGCDAVSCMFCNSLAATLNAFAAGAVERFAERLMSDRVIEAAGPILAPGPRGWTSTRVMRSGYAKARAVVRAAIAKAKGEP